MNVKTDFLFQNTELPLEERVMDLISRFTLEEKINLMCQYQAEIPRLGVKPYKHGTKGHMESLGWAKRRYSRKISDWRVHGIQICFMRLAQQSEMKQGYIFRGILQ